VQRSAGAVEDERATLAPFGAALISRFFIDRPIFAAVLSIVITLAGAISVFTLPLAQFPQISPPTVSVSCVYPGASARDVAGSVAAPIEQQVNGVEGMLYMSSSCTNDGSYNLTVTFNHGVDLNMAQVLVQNRVSLAVPLLPDVIKQTGVTVKKRSPDILVGFALNSPSGRYDQLYLSNFAMMQIRDELSRLEGISDVMLFGQRDYSMRIWVDPDRLAARNMTSTDVVRAIRDQNAQLATGMIGSPPTGEDQNFQITLSTLGRLKDVEQFENLIVKAGDDGRVVRVKDIGRVELGAKNSDVNVVFDEKETVFLAVFQLPDANALDTYDRAVAKMHELEKGFPEGVNWEVAFDQTPYTRESIHEVFNALRDAIILVAIVVLVFLQNWRSSIIPLVAVPVAIIGTFAAMAAFGFSLNNLTLFGLVLSIGIVVDDAIVVVEAVEHHIEHGLSPREATIKAMQQVSGPVIAVGLVLSAVFVPCAFISGITGQFFRQFALTISVSTIISAFNSLTLSPALTALLLKPVSKENKHSSSVLPWPAYALAGCWLGWEILAPRLEHLMAGHESAAFWVAVVGGLVAGAALSLPLNWLLGHAFRLFNLAFDYTGIGYTWIVGKMLRVSVVVLLVYGGLLYLTAGLFNSTPKGFIPSQDMGYLFVSVQLPDAASSERTSKVMRKLAGMAATVPGVLHVSDITGQSFALNAFGSNFGTMFINLEPYSERRTPDKSSMAVLQQLMGRFSTVTEAIVMVFPPPPIRGVGRAGGFAMVLEDRGDAGLDVLQAQTENLVRVAREDPKMFGPGIFSAFSAKVPMLKIEPDLRAAMEKGVNLRDFADTLQVYQGSLYVNDFNLFGRTWQVIVQAEQGFRDQVEDLPKLKVRNESGAMVPLGSLAEIREINGPLVLTRYNMYSAATIQGAGAPGVSSRDAIDIMAGLANRELPKSMNFEWTEMAFLELMAGNTAMVIFGFAVMMVFLVLAAQYESWSLPLAIILVVPMCLLSSIIGVNIAKLDINIFTQIGFVVLVGLASKNAILIVEFAKQKREAGESRRQATLEACRLRLRPIVMTSFAFILGVVPLMLAHGAGAEMRQTLGTAVFSGMLGVTLFGIFLTPVFFFTIDWLGATPLFASRAMQIAGSLSLGLVTLKPVRVLASHLRRQAAGDRPARTAPASKKPLLPETVAVRAGAQETITEKPPVPAGSPTGAASHAGGPNGNATNGGMSQKSKSDGGPPGALPPEAAIHK
jgi:multidrug efflux pump